MHTKAQIDLKRGLWFSQLPEKLQDEVLRSSSRIKLKRGKLSSAGAILPSASTASSAAKRR